MRGSEVLCRLGSWVGLLDAVYSYVVDGRGHGAMSVLLHSREIRLLTRLLCILDKPHLTSPLGLCPRMHVCSTYVHPADAIEPSAVKDEFGHRVLKSNIIRFPPGKEGS